MDELVATFLMNHLFRKEKRRFYHWTHELRTYAFDPFFIGLILYISPDFNRSFFYSKT